MNQTIRVMTLAWAFLAIVLAACGGVSRGGDASENPEGGESTWPGEGCQNPLPQGAGGISPTGAAGGSQPGALGGAKMEAEGGAPPAALAGTGVGGNMSSPATGGEPQGGASEVIDPGAAGRPTGEGGATEEPEAACRLELPGPDQASVGKHPTAIASGDFNGDSILDLATANGRGNSVSLLWGSGDGTFLRGGEVDVGADPEGLAVGDWNGDGFLDLATANQGGDNMTVLLNSGVGTFETYDYRARPGPMHIVAADLNGDGWLDLALTAVKISGQSHDLVQVFRNLGHGAFEEDDVYSVGREPWGITAADVNGDGLADLAVTSWGDDQTTVLLNDGTGKFPEGVPYAVASSPHNVVLEDLDGDDLPELIVGSFNGDTNLTIWWNLGNGSFVQRTDMKLGTVPNALLASDLDADGDNDLVFCGDGDFWGINGCGVVRNDGKGQLAQPVHYVTGSSSDSATIADFNQDRRRDLATANFVDDNVTVLLGQGAGNLLAPSIEAGGQKEVTAELYWDLNGDSKLDLIVADAPSNLLSVRLANPAGGFLDAVTYAVPHPEAIQAAVFGSNERPDLLVTDLTSGRLFLLRSLGAGAFAPYTELTLPAPAGVCVAADVTGDGKADLIYAMKAPGKSLIVMAGEGNGKFAKPAPYPLDGSATALVALDLDHDGQLDLAAALAKLSGDQVQLRELALFRNQGAGVLGKALLDPNSPAQFLSKADLNADGLQDLVFARSEYAGVSVRFAQPGGSLSDAKTYPLLTAPRALLTADVDGNGLVDVLTLSEAVRNVSVLQNLGGGRLGHARNYVAGRSPTAFGSADVNGDGKADITIANTYANDVSVLLASCNP